jgi:hypothetical protein
MKAAARPQRGLVTTRCEAPTGCEQRERNQINYHVHTPAATKAAS